MTFSPNEDHYCPICMQLVPKMIVMLPGKNGMVEKAVQPRCKCEVEAWEQDRLESIERKQKAEIERKFTFSALGERFQDSRFDKFKVRDGAEKAAKMALGYATNFDTYGGESLLIWGVPGNGKSHLAAAVCHDLKSKGKIPIFQSVPELLERIRSTFRKGSNESEREIMDALRDCDLLVLDDIGSEKISDWVLDVLFRMIDGRYRANKPTLFTTNFTPTELLERFMPADPSAQDEIAARRIHDRILEVSLIVENKASSYRLEVAKDRVKADDRRKWA